MRIWITRTEPGATRLAEALEAAGHDAWVRPVQRVEHLPTPAPDGPFDLTVFLSEHAVHAALANGWPRTPALAIGPATQAALDGHGIAAAIPDVASSEGIVAHLADTPPTRVLLATGQGGRDALPGMLAARGTAVATWRLYRRLPLRDPLPAAPDIDAIVAGSAGGLRVAADLWFASGRGGSVPLIVPSARVADTARGIGFTRILVGPGAGAHATVATIGGLCSETRAR
ncbi:MAG: uroporphyrinogen-III synthase [Gammaproteobacteria bacterium]|nr:uroporphyrinogen-III synthase [Gammaproteobacteria bacterium]